MAVYELRTYDIHPSKMPNINARFQNHTMSLLKKHGIAVVGFWERLVEDAGQLIYLCKFETEEQVRARWDAFRADPEWQRVKAESEAQGPLVKQVTSVVMRPTPYSPVQ